MKNKIIITLALVVFICIGIMSYLDTKLQATKEDRDKYKQNTYTLLNDTYRYQTKDSLNVSSVGKLQLKLSEYEKHRADDLKLIESFKIDKKKLESITTTQTQTIHALRGTVRDSIVYRDNHIVDTLRCVTIREKWFDMNGCMNKLNEFTGRFENRDSLAIVNHVKQKRFLGFLWYYGKKEYKVDVVSRNPNTTIEGVEYIELKN